jgi:cellulose synthase operon protein C
MLRFSARLTALLLLVAASASAETPDPAATLTATVTAAEASLQRGDLRAAKALYANALLEGLVTLGDLARIDGQPEQARASFDSALADVQANADAIQNAPALHVLALALIDRGDAGQAIEILRAFCARHPDDHLTRRLLARAHAASGDVTGALRELETAAAAASSDPELAYALAQDYLRLSKVEPAERLFEQLLAQRPIPEAYVLVGRAYRDADDRGRARAALRKALELDPRVRRAHYYLGTLVLADDETHSDRLERAIAELEAELAISPADALTYDQLGLALLDAGRLPEASVALERAVQLDPGPLYLFHLGRVQLQLDKAAEAVTTLRKALDLASTRKTGDSLQEGIHYQLGLALRRTGAAKEALEQLGIAKRLASEREQAAPSGTTRATIRPGESEPTQDRTSPLGALPPAERETLRARVGGMLARSYLNLGVMQAQRQEFAQAADLFQRAAELDPATPQIHRSLGIAHYNTRRFVSAAAAFDKALASERENAELRRLLALSWLSAEAYDKAAALLRDDPQRSSDSELQTAYLVALIHTQRAAEAQAILARLIAREGASAELSVLLAQAQAALGRDAAASATLGRALTLKPDVADAHLALGKILLERRQLPEAERELRAELATSPGDLGAVCLLAEILQQTGRSAEAVKLLRSVLDSSPEAAEPRRILGTILLASGVAEEAATQLEAAARLRPRDAAIHRQLGAAYERLGRKEQAAEQLRLAREVASKR